MYLMEYVYQRFEPLYSPQIHSAKSRAENALEQLRQLGPDAAKYAGELNESLNDEMFYLEETAAFAGIAVGLELGQILR